MNNNIVKIFTLLLVALPTIASAQEYTHRYEIPWNMGKQKNTCYAMNGNKVAKKGSCVVGQASNTGKEFVQINFDKKTYQDEFEMMDDLEPRRFDRNIKTFKKYSKDIDLVNVETLSCYMFTKQKTEICYNPSKATWLK